MLECLRRNFDRHSTRKNGFEAYLSFHLQHVFERGLKLDEVFAFRSDFSRQTDLSWQHEPFELVTIVSSQDRSKPCIFTVTHDSGPSSNVGFLAQSGAEVLEWIESNEAQFTFCFPQESLGPDILFFVQLKHSEQILLVAIQCKKYMIVEKEDLVHGMRSVAPAWFWRSKDIRVCCSYTYSAP
jgi:hypothetical protein